MKWVMTYAYLCLVYLYLFIQAKDTQAITENAKTTASEELTLKINDAIAQDPLQVGSMPSPDARSSPRHRAEKAHLMQRMRRSHGKWGTSHPRYRLLEALFGFIKYRERNMAELDRWRNLYKNVSKKQKLTLESVVQYKEKLDEIEERIYRNEVLLKDIVTYAKKFYGIEQKELNEHIEEAENNNRQADKISVLQTMKHFVRDWANEGFKERNEAFPCILSTLHRLHAGHSVGRHPVKVLLPGSGLGRLGNEIANLGDFEVTINEWSMYMNIAYRYLEGRTYSDSMSLYPFIDSLSHHATTHDLHRELTVPDVLPSPSVLLVEGDFTTVFADQGGHYDVIVTHFFIDTARNLMSYFDTIHRLLRKGGHWINFGPLLYGTAPFLQLSLDEIIAVVGDMGFEFQDLDEKCGNITFEGKKVRWREAEYGFNARALTQNAYKAQAWVVQKT